MAELWEKLKTMVMGTPDDYDEEYDEEYEDYDEEYEDYQSGRESKPRFDFMKNFRRSSNDEEEEEQPHSYRGGSMRNDNVIDINARVKMSVVVATPQSIENASEVTRNLIKKKTVIVNLEGVEKEMAQRITDFLSGSCYALDGSIKQISSRIYIIGPYDVAITGEFKEELAASGINLPRNVFRNKTY